MTVPVMHPTIEPFFEENDYLIINLIGDLYIEVKAKVRDDLSGDEAYSWDFGDSSGDVNGYEVTHKYDEPGEKVITVQIDTIHGVLTHSITFVLPDGTGQTLHAEAEQDRERRAA
jgi:PKD domain